jgi:dTDP-4-amino-4,6-dideoxygalactose transaminase
LRFEGGATDLEARFHRPPLPVARRVSASTIALPTFVGLGSDDLDRICDSLRTHLRRGG